MFALGSSRSSLVAGQPLGRVRDGEVALPCRAGQSCEEIAFVSAGPRSSERRMQKPKIERFAPVALLANNVEDGNPRKKTYLANHRTVGNVTEEGGLFPIHLRAVGTRRGGRMGRRGRRRGVEECGGLHGGSVFEDNRAKARAQSGELRAVVKAIYLPVELKGIAEPNSNLNLAVGWSPACRRQRGSVVLAPSSPNRWL